MKTILEKYLTVLNEENPESLPVGKHNDVPDDKFNPEQIKKGLKVESEHSDDPKIQLAIVKDHLSECKLYYDFLEEMEIKCKGKK